MSFACLTARRAPILVSQLLWVDHCLDNFKVRKVGLPRSLGPGAESQHVSSEIMLEL